MLDIDPPRSRREGPRSQPGKMFLVDTVAAAHRLRRRDQAARSRRRSRTRRGSPRTRSSSRPLDDVPSLYTIAHDERHACSGPSATRAKTCKIVLGPMAMDGEEPVGSHGHRHPARGALRSSRSTLFRYFKQQFAQVTNPPIDPIREEIVMSLVSCVGGEGNLLEETPRAVPPARAAASDPHATTTSRSCARTCSPISARPRFRCISRAQRPIPSAASTTALDELCRAARRAIDDGRQHPRPQRSRRRRASTLPSRASSRPRRCTTT